MTVAVPAYADTPHEKAGLAFFDKNLKKAKKTISTKLWSIVQDARKSAFHQFAEEQARRTLMFVPDHKDAREFLGYVKKKKEWVLDPAEAAKVKHMNTRNTSESMKSFNKRIDKWKERKAAVDSFIATKIAKVGDTCRAKGFEDQAKKAYRRALSLDRDNDTARKGMGFQKVGKLWLSPAQIAAVKQATEGAWVAEASPLEKALGTPLHKMESPHFYLQDDNAKESLPAAIKGLEVLYAYYLADIGKDPTLDVFEGKKARFAVVSTQPLWEKWVDGFSNAPDKKWTKESNIYVDKKAFNAGTLRSETAEEVDTRDPLLHHATHMLNHVLWDASRVAWIDEGLTYYYTVKIQETTRTHCVQRAGGGYGEGEAIGGNKDWNQSEFWRQYLRDLVKSKNDLELRTLLNRKLAVLELPHTVKAWALISWLMEKERDKFLTFMTELKKGEAKQEDLLQKIFGKSVEDIDKAWRAYAARAY